MKRFSVIFQIKLFVCKICRYIEIILKIFQSFNTRKRYRQRFKMIFCFENPRKDIPTPFFFHHNYTTTIFLPPQFFFHHNFFSTPITPPHFFFHHYAITTFLLTRLKNQNLHFQAPPFTTTPLYFPSHHHQVIIDRHRVG